MAALLEIANSSYAIFCIDLGEIEYQIHLEASNVGKRRLGDLSVAERLRNEDSSLNGEHQIVASWSTIKSWKPRRNKICSLCCLKSPNIRAIVCLRCGYQIFSDITVTIGGKVDQRSLVATGTQLVYPSIITCGRWREERSPLQSHPTVLTFSSFPKTARWCPRQIL